MNLKRLARTAATTTAAAFLAAIAAGAAATPASAGTVGPAATGCIIEVTLVKAWNLQEPPQDEIYLRLGTQYTDTRNFAEFQERQGAEFGDVTEFVALNNRLRIAVGESDLGQDESLGAFYVTCTDEAGTGSDHVTEHASDYEVSYRVSVV
jgi:hypothetical protein